MPFAIASIGAQLANTIFASLRSDSGKVKALAIAEGESLAHALARITGLLAQGQIDREEAGVLVRIQRDASEAVLASLAEISRAAAHNAIKLGLNDIIGRIDGPLTGELL